MATEKIAGSKDSVETSFRTEFGDREATVIEVEGLYSYLNQCRAAIIQQSCPSGMTVETSNLSTTSDGMGKLTIRCVSYEDGSTFGAERTTFRVDMQEVTYDLEDHPYIADGRDIILKWLSTDESKRVDGNTYKYLDKDGELQPISHQSALRFIAAYMAGIKTFNRYFPVIERISIYKNPPGMSRSDRSFTGGSPSFSQDVGKFKSPPINLNGFNSTNFFMSKDSWQQNSDTTWTRTEQWTYTPDGSNGTHAWIYSQLS